MDEAKAASDDDDDDAPRRRRRAAADDGDDPSEAPEPRKEKKKFKKPPGPRHLGVIRKFNGQKGSITPTAGSGLKADDVYVNAKDVKPGSTLEAGDFVDYALQSAKFAGDRPPKAVDVHVYKKGDGGAPAPPAAPAAAPERPKVPRHHADKAAPERPKPPRHADRAAPKPKQHSPPAELAAAAREARGGNGAFEMCGAGSGRGPEHPVAILATFGTGPTASGGNRAGDACERTFALLSREPTAVEDFQVRFLETTRRESALDSDARRRAWALALRDVLRARPRSGIEYPFGPGVAFEATSPACPRGGWRKPSEADRGAAAGRDAERFRGAG